MDLSGGRGKSCLRFPLCQTHFTQGASLAPELSAPRSHPLNRQKVDQYFQLLYEGKLDDVLEHQEELEKDHSPVVGTLRGLTLYHAKEFGKAIEALEKVIEVEPENPVANLYIGLSLFAEHRAAEAGLWFEEKCLMFPHRQFLADFIEVLWPLRFLTNLREKVPADADLEESRSTHDLIGKLPDPESMSRGSRKRQAEKLIKQGSKQYLKDNRESAFRYFSKAWQFDDSNKQAMVFHCFSLMSEGRFEEAESFITPKVERVFEKDPDISAEEIDPDLLMCYAWVLHELEDYKRSLQVISIITPEGPEDFGAYFLASVNWLMLDDLEKFHRCFEISMTEYFIDTWELTVRPFLRSAISWMKEDSVSAGGVRPVMREGV